VNEASVVQIVQSLQDALSEVGDYFLGERSIFLAVLLQGALLGEFHDDRNLFFGKIDLIIGCNFIIPKLFEAVDELRVDHLQLEQVGIGSELINDLVGVLFFIELIV
jgi:hypothetical protein